MKSYPTKFKSFLWKIVQMGTLLKSQNSIQTLDCVAGGICERASGGGAAIFPREGIRERRSREWNSTRLFTNPLTASPLAFTASLPKQKNSRAKSRQLRRLPSRELSFLGSQRFVPIKKIKAVRVAKLAKKG